MSWNSWRIFKYKFSMPLILKLCRCHSVFLLMTMDNKCQVPPASGTFFRPVERKRSAIKEQAHTAKGSTRVNEPRVAYHLALFHLGATVALTHPAVWKGSLIYEFDEIGPNLVTVQEDCQRPQFKFRQTNLLNHHRDRRGYFFSPALT